MELLRQPGCWLRSSHTFKECVIAHWSSDSAPKITGAKLYTEAMERITLVEEQCMKDEAEVVRHCGHHTRENAGMSSER